MSNRVKYLEELLKRFPGNAGLNQQVIDIKDADAKYLPITTQIIAVNNDINRNKEQLMRLNDRLNQLFLIKLFLVEALPLAATELDGILLSKSLLSIEEKLRKGLPATDIKNRQVNRYQYPRQLPTSLGTAFQILPEKAHRCSYGA